MPNQNSTDKRMIAVGVTGIFALLIGAIGYALWDSGTHYEPDQINQLVLEQNSNAPWLDQPKAELPR